MPPRLERQDTSRSMMSRYSSSTLADDSVAGSESENYDRLLDVANATSFEDVADANILYIAGRDYKDRPVVVLNLWRMGSLDKQKVLLFAIQQLDQVVEEQYSVVISHNSQVTPQAGWLKESFAKLSRKYRKNLAHLYILHPSGQLKMMLNVVGPKLSATGYKKVKFVENVIDMHRYMPMDRIVFPDKVYKVDLTKRSTTKNAVVLAPKQMAQFYSSFLWFLSEVESKRNTLQAMNARLDQRRNELLIRDAEDMMKKTATPRDFMIEVEDNMQKYQNDSRDEVEFSAIELAKLFRSIGRASNSLQGLSDAINRMEGGAARLIYSSGDDGGVEAKRQSSKIVDYRLKWNGGSSATITNHRGEVYAAPKSPPPKSPKPRGRELDKKSSSGSLRAPSSGRVTAPRRTDQDNARLRLLRKGIEVNVLSDKGQQLLVSIKLNNSEDFLLISAPTDGDKKAMDGDMVEINAIESVLYGQYSPAFKKLDDFKRSYPWLCMSIVYKDKGAKGARAKKKYMDITAKSDDDLQNLLLAVHCLIPKSAYPKPSPGIRGGKLTAGCYLWERMSLRLKFQASMSNMPAVSFLAKAIRARLDNCKKCRLQMLYEPKAYQKVQVKCGYCGHVSTFAPTKVLTTIELAQLIDSRKARRKSSSNVLSSSSSSKSIVAKNSTSTPKGLSKKQSPKTDTKRSKSSSRSMSPSRAPQSPAKPTNGTTKLPPTAAKPQPGSPKTTSSKGSLYGKSSPSNGSMSPSATKIGKGSPKRSGSVPPPSTSTALVPSSSPKYGLKRK